MMARHVPLKISFIIIVCITAQRNEGKAFLRYRKAFLRNFSAFIRKGKSVYMFDCDLIMVVMFVAVSSHVSLVKNNMLPLLVNNSKV